MTPYEEKLEDEGSIIMNMKFITFKGGAIEETKGTMISTKEQRVVVGSKSLVRTEIGIKSLIKRELEKVLE